MLTLKDIRQNLTDAFGPEETWSTLRLLIEDMLGYDWAQVRLDENLLATTDMQKLADAVAQMKAGMPPQHITGVGWFYGRAFRVSPQVLIPRPETEFLAEWVLQELATGSQSEILDIGTGSGCLAITLALEAPTAKVEAWDISLDALAVAKKNALELEVEVDFYQQDIRHWAGTGKRWNVWVSNPPYVPEKERAEMSPRVRDHEPGLALFVPNDDPLQFYRYLAQSAPSGLIRGGRLYAEIHADYGPEVVQLWQDQGLKDVVLKQDIHGRDRMVRGTYL